MFQASIFSEILKLIPHGLVSQMAAKHGSERWRKSFRTHDHLVAMLGAQLGGAGSLRDVESLFEAHARQRYHLNCGAIKRSTLSDANATRGWQVFGAIAQDMIARSGRVGRDARTFLAALDSTCIRLAGRGHDWAEETCTRTHNQGLKVHMLIEPEQSGLEFVSVTGMNVNDITAAQDVTLEQGRIYLFDKGYCDYNWWAKIIDAKAHFVTRLKANAAFKVIERRKLEPGEDSNVVSDKVIELTNKAPRGGKINRLAGRALRLVEIVHPAGKNRPFWIVSDRLDVSAEQIAAWYKQRWSIEIFFKWLKQNLKIKRFMGQSKNAILIQIFTAIITWLLVRKYHKLRATSWPRPAKYLMVFLRSNLFHPYPKPPKPQSSAPPDQPDLWSTKP